VTNNADSNPSLSILRIYLLLDTFVEDNRDDLANAVLLRLDGVRVSLHGVPA